MRNDSRRGVKKKKIEITIKDLGISKNNKEVILEF